jgi:hypothetical protein
MTKLTQEGLKELLTYNPLSGSFVWVKHNQPGLHVNKLEAGTLKKTGYRAIQIHGRAYQEHLLAWLYVYGSFPIAAIDHINGVRDDNRIENLRLATPSQNSFNRRTQSNNRTGFKGVSLIGVKYRARIRDEKGTLISLGVFLTPELAHEAYCIKARKLHGEFFNAG